MNHSLQNLSERRKHLVDEAAALRLRLASDMDKLRKPLDIVDQGFVVLRFIKNHSTWLVGSITLLTALKPIRMFKWLLSGRMAWLVLGRFFR